MGSSERILRRVERILERADEAEVATNWPEVKRLAEEVLAIAPANTEAIAYLRSADAELGNPSSTVAHTANDKQRERPAPRSVFDRLPVARLLAPVIAQEAPEETPKNPQELKVRTSFIRSKTLWGVVGLVVLAVAIADSYQPTCLEVDARWGQFLPGLDGRSFEKITAVRIDGDVMSNRTKDDGPKDWVNLGNDGLFKYLIGARIQGTNDISIFITTEYEFGEGVASIPFNDVARSLYPYPALGSGRGWDLKVLPINEKSVIGCL